MSAWPEAIYIINKINQTFENSVNFTNDIANIDDINRRINNLNSKIRDGGVIKETEAEYRNSHDATGFYEVTVKALPQHFNKELLYSEMSQQEGSGAVTKTLTIPDRLLSSGGNLTDFSYSITSNGDEVNLLYLYSEYHVEDNFSYILPEAPKFEPAGPYLLANYYYDLKSILNYLITQDQYLELVVNNMNERLNNFLEENNLSDLATLVNSANSKIAIISTTEPQTTPTQSLTNLTVWLKAVPV